MSPSPRYLTATAEAVARQLEDDVRKVVDQARKLKASRLGPRMIHRIQRRVGLSMQGMGEGLVKDVDQVERVARQRARNIALDEDAE